MTNVKENFMTIYNIEKTLEAREKSINEVAKNMEIIRNKSMTTIFEIQSELVTVDSKLNTTIIN